MKLLSALAQQVTVLVFLALLPGCAMNPATGRRDFVLMTEAREISIGREYHQKVLDAYRPYDDPKLQAYVERVGERLAAKSHRSDLDYRFTVLDSPEVNAFATPGGYIYITRGILAYLGSEAELAAVLGHEIGHVTARHAVRQHSTQQVTQMGLILGSILMPKFASQGGTDLYNVLGGALIQGYGRDMELEADRLGAQYVARVGYRPEAMLGVIGVLKDQELFEAARAAEEGREPQIYHGLFASHPDADRRLQEVVRAARQIQSETDSVTFRSDGVAAYLDHVDGMSFGPGSAEGLKIHVMPAGRGLTYSNLVRRSRLPNYPEAQLRLLNGQYPAGEPMPGKLIKIVE